MHKMELTRDQLWTLQLAVSGHKVQVVRDLVDANTENKAEIELEYEKLNAMDSILWAMLFPEEEN